MSARLQYHFMTRRGFIGYASACATSAFLISPAARSRSAGLAPSSKPLSMGYSAAGEPLSPARLLSSGDRRFAETGARIGLVEFVIPGRVASGIQSASMFFDYRVSGVPEVIPVHVWQYDTHPVKNLGAGAYRVVPVSPQHGLTISLVLDLGGSVREHLTEQLTVTNEPGRAKLARGTYLIGLGGTDTHASFAWQHMEWREVDQASELQTQRHRRTLLHASGSPVEFAYLVMTVDYAKLNAKSDRVEA